MHTHTHTCIYKYAYINVALASSGYNSDNVMQSPLGPTDGICQHFNLI